MYSWKKLKNQKGFTIVELLIVIVVIGILATLVIVTFSGIQRKARDTERKTDINAVTSQLEAFYAEAGYYPLLANLNDADWRSDNEFKIDTDAFQDPKGSAATIAATASGTAYGYAVTTDADASCASDETTCTKFTLQADLESSDTNYIKTSN
jgi:prepilin-type N-terminal cleavage/methylation domain-containing protein